MDRLHYEIFGKKIALFYHPLFRRTIEAWSEAFVPSSKNISIIIFMELNARIQKAMIYPAETLSSMNSALTDWYKELEDISLREKKPLHAPKPLNPTKYNLPDVSTLLSELHCEPCLTSEEYGAFFKQNRQHIAMKYSQTYLSLVGFSKFLFDLCVSWCENLDVELFVIFLNGLFMHITSGPTIKDSKLREISTIELFIDPFYNVFKAQKTHYQRYVKGNLNSFQPWCEWNYFRLKEMKSRIVESFLQAFPENERQRVLDLEEVFDSAQTDIPTDLTTFNLATITKLVPDETSNSKQPSAFKQSTGETLSMPSGTFKATQKREMKKVSMPIIGKSIAKQQNDDPNAGVVKTIDSFTFFMDDLSEVPAQPHLQLMNEGLYPIWEKEFSECNSTMMSFRDYRLQNSGLESSQDFIRDIGTGNKSRPLSADSVGNSPGSLMSKGESVNQRDFITVMDQNERDSTLRVEGSSINEHALSQFSINGAVQPESSSIRDKDQKGNRQFQAKKSSSRGFMPSSLPQRTLTPVESTSHSFQKNMYGSRGGNKQSEVKRGGYVFNKRKQNLIPSMQTSNDHLSSEHDSQENHKHPLAQPLDGSFKRIPKPKPLPKSFQVRKDVSRPRGEKENNAVVRGGGRKRTAGVKFGLENIARESSTTFPYEAQSAGLPRSMTDVGRTVEKIKQLYGPSSKLESLKLPKSRKEPQSQTSDSLEINGYSSDRVEANLKTSSTTSLPFVKLDAVRGPVNPDSRTKTKKGESKTVFSKQFFGNKLK